MRKLKRSPLTPALRKRLLDAFIELGVDRGTELLNLDERTALRAVCGDPLQSRTRVWLERRIPEVEQELARGQVA